MFVCYTEAVATDKHYHSPRMFDNYLTIPVRLRRSRLKGLLMNEKTINTREFLRNYKKFIAANETVIISNHGKPEGVLIPYPEWEKNTQRKSKIITQEMIDKYTKDLPGFTPISNREIDEAAYPYPNKINKSRKK